VSYDGPPGCRKRRSDVPNHLDPDPDPDLDLDRDRDSEPDPDRDTERRSVVNGHARRVVAWVSWRNELCYGGFQNAQSLYQAADVVYLDSQCVCVDAP
jgi:hypothetical protein